MSKNIAIDFNKVDSYTEMNTSLRLINDYISGKDKIVTRIDVKYKNRQYCVALASSYSKGPEPGQKITDYGDLITPSKGVEHCLNLKVNKLALIEALKELVSDLEND